MDNNRMDFSVVIPVYGCSQCLKELSFRLEEVFNQINKDYEIIFVDDCSLDDSWNTIADIKLDNPNVRAFRLSRNFGQHAAIYAGLSKSVGEWVVVMDCDLQDKPEEIPTLFNHVSSGEYKVALGYRVLRQDSYFKKIGSLIFYKLLGFLTDTEQNPNVANFGVYHRDVIRAVLEMPEQSRYFPTMIQWVGYKKTLVKIEHGARIHGQSAYSLRKLIRLGLQVSIAFSNKPMRLMVWVGIVMSLFSMIVAMYYTFSAVLGRIVVQGWAALMVSIWFLSGLIIMCLGVCGIYIGTTFSEVKRRPIFIIDEEL